MLCLAERRRHRAVQNFGNGVAAAVDFYVSQTPLYDEGVGATVTRRCTARHMAGGEGVRVGCEVFLHYHTHNLNRGEYNAEWTQGLLAELARHLRAKGYQVTQVPEVGEIESLVVR